MAKTPTANTVEKLLSQSEKAEAKKLESQRKKGKGFTNYGQGVIPEQVWKNLPGKEKSNGSK